MFTHQHEETLAQAEKALALNPSYSSMYYIIALAHAQQGQFTEAIQDLERVVELRGWQADRVGYLGYLQAISGDTVRARQELAVLHDLGEVGVHGLALVYAGLGETDEALEWLHRAVETDTGPLSYLKVHPVYDSLRSDPRFQLILKEAGFD